MRTKAFNEEVLYPNERIVQVSASDISKLKSVAVGNARHRIRLCTHQNVDSAVHEMIIIHELGTYVRPHKHLNRTESFHIIEGEVDVVLFDDQGKIFDVIAMGPYGSSRVFYYRIAEPVFHTLLIPSPVLVFRETTQGPFERTSTVFAPWAPQENDSEDVRNYMNQLTELTQKGRKAQQW